MRESDNLVRWKSDRKKEQNVETGCESGDRSGIRTLDLLIKRVLIIQENQFRYLTFHEMFPIDFLRLSSEVRQISAAVLLASLAPIHALAADTELPIRTRIISLQEAIEICSAESPPAWCPDHLRQKEPVTDIEFSEWTPYTDADETAEYLNGIEPAGGTSE